MDVVSFRNKIKTRTKLVARVFFSGEVILENKVKLYLLLLFAFCCSFVLINSFGKRRLARSVRIGVSAFFG